MVTDTRVTPRAPSFPGGGAEPGGRHGGTAEDALLGPRVTPWGGGVTAVHRALRPALLPLLTGAHWGQKRGRTDSRCPEETPRSPTLDSGPEVVHAGAGGSAAKHSGRHLTAAPAPRGACRLPKRTAGPRRRRAPPHTGPSPHCRAQGRSRRPSLQAGRLSRDPPCLTPPAPAPSPRPLVPSDLPLSPRAHWVTAPLGPWRGPHCPSSPPGPAAEDRAGAPAPGPPLAARLDTPPLSGPPWASQVLGVSRHRPPACTACTTTRGQACPACGRSQTCRAGVRAGRGPAGTQATLPPGCHAARAPPGRGGEREVPRLPDTEGS